MRMMPTCLTCLLIGVSSAAGQDALDYNRAISSMGLQEVHAVQIGRRLHTSAFKLELPEGWSSNVEGNEMVMQPLELLARAEMIAIVAVKGVASEDDLRKYVVHLMKPRPKKDLAGQHYYSTLLWSHYIELNGQVWADAMHLGSEIPGFYTRYLATLHDRWAGLITLSVARSSIDERFLKESLDFARSFEIMQVAEPIDRVKLLGEAFNVVTPPPEPNLLPPGTVLLEYKVGLEESHVRCFSREKEVVQALLRWRELGSPGYEVIAQRVRWHLAEVGAAGVPKIDVDLFELLVPAPIRERVLKASCVMVMPCAPLRALPFETLAIDEDKGLWLDSGPPVRYLTQGQLAASSEGRSEEHSRVVIFGSPELDPTRLFGQPPPEDGYTITTMRRHTVSAKAGLLAGDIILSCDGTALEKHGMLEQLLRDAARKGSDDNTVSVVLSIWRNGTTMDKTISFEPAIGEGVAWLKESLGLDGFASSKTEHRIYSQARKDVRILMQRHVYIRERFDPPLQSPPDSLGEIEALQRLLTGRKRASSLSLLAEEATPGGLLKEAVGADLVHIATPIRLSKTMFLDNAVTTRIPSAVTPDDMGFLRVENLLGESWRGKLAGVRLVSLSQCTVPRSDPDVADGLYALALGFHASGAPTVLASLWETDDLTSSIMLCRVYENMCGLFDQARRVADTDYAPGSSIPAAQALLEARRWLRMLDAARLRSAIDSYRLPADTLTPEARAAQLREPQAWGGWVLLER